MGRRYSDVFKARAVRMVLERCGDSTLRRKGIHAVARCPACRPTTLWAWVLQAEKEREIRPMADGSPKERRLRVDPRAHRDLRPKVVIDAGARRSRASLRSGEETENP